MSNGGRVGSYLSVQSVVCLVLGQIAWKSQCSRARSLSTGELQSWCEWVKEVTSSVSYINVLRLCATTD